VQQGMQRLDDLSLRLAAGIKNYLRAETAHLASIGGSLVALDPRNVLKRGFALVRNESGGLVSSILKVKLGKTVDVLLHDGSFDATVKDIKN